MKRHLLVMLFAIICTAGFAQVSFNAKIGMNLSSYMGKGSDLAKFKPGARVGVGLEYDFNDMIALQPSLFFSQRGARFHENVKTTLSEFDSKIKVNQLYFDIPVNVQFRFEVADNANLVLATGPYIGVGIGGKTKTTNEIREGSITTEQTSKVSTFGDKGNDLHRFDAGWGIGLGVEFSRYIVGFDTQLGFCNTSEYSSTKNVNLALMFGVRF